MGGPVRTIGVMDGSPFVGQSPSRAVLAVTTVAALLVSPACSGRHEPTAISRTSVAPSPSVKEARWPDQTNTGVPDGVTLRDSGSVEVKEDGAVIDGLHIRGELTISANDVVVRNTIVETNTDLYAVLITNGVTGVVLENIEVNNLDGAGINVYFQGGSGVLRAADIRAGVDGVRIEADDVVVEDSYIHHLHRQPDGHHDTIQIRKGDNVTLRRNNLQAYNPETKDPMNSALQIGSLVGDDQISNLLVEGNLMNGGTYTISGGGRGEVDSAVYRGNQFGRDYMYGTHGGLENSTWDSSNVWKDTGQPVTK